MEERPVANLGTVWLESVKDLIFIKTFFLACKSEQKNRKYFFKFIFENFFQILYQDSNSMYKLLVYTICVIFRYSMLVSKCFKDTFSMQKMGWSIRI